MLVVGLLLSSFFLLRRIDEITYLIYSMKKMVCKLAVNILALKDNIF